MKIDHLELSHTDERGYIQDIFQTKTPDATTLIQTVAGGIRGNHVHHETVQHVFMLSGMMFAYSRMPASAQVVRLELTPGDLLRHDAGEEHAYEAITDCTFLAFAEGVRKGQNYEADTMRVPSLIDAYKAQLPR